MCFQISLILFILFLVCTTSAQTPTNDFVPAKITQTTKYDEFGDISEKEFGPELKKFSDFLTANNNLQGYVIFYNSFNGTPFKQTSFFAGRKIASYAKYFSHGYDPPRVTYLQPGMREHITTELWAVPPGGIFPQPKDSIPSRRDSRYKLELLGTSRLQLQEARLKKVDQTPEPDTNQDHSRLMSESSGNDSEAELWEVLGKDKTWSAVLIFYADDTEFDIQKSDQIIRAQLQKSVPNTGVELGRVKVIYGGYRAETEIEMWIVPENGIEPEPMPDEKIEEPSR